MSSADRPATRRFLPHGEVQVHLLDLDHPATDAGRPDAPLHGSLDAAERARAEQFVNPEARRRYVRSRIGLRTLLGSYLGLEPARVPIVLSKEGKPRLGLPEHPAQIGFNLSHAGRYGLLAFVRGRQVGVDFEAVQAQPGLDEVAARFFAPQERAAFRRLAADELVRAFYRTWTRREAVLKALGSGLTDTPEEVWVSVGAAPASWLLGARSPLPVQTWLTRDLHADPGYCAALAVPGGAGFRVRLIQTPP